MLIVKRALRGPAVAHQDVRCFQTAITMAFQEVVVKQSLRPCKSLNSNGASDEYLPGKYELKVHHK